MNHSNFLCELIRGCNYRSYLELGVYIGETLVPISKMVDRYIGVDINPHPLIEPVNMFYGTTDAFFAQNKNMYDFIFIDADHKMNSVHSDLMQSLAILNKGGLIILHDTDPIRAELLQDGYCSDCCKIRDVLDDMKELNYVTLPFLDPGLTLISRKHEERHSQFI